MKKLMIFISILFFLLISSCKIDDIKNDKKNNGKVIIHDSTSDSTSDSINDSTSDSTSDNHEIKKIIAVYGKTKYGKSIYWSIK